MVLSSIQSYADDLIYGCINKTNGRLRVVDSPSNCLTSEIAIYWNKAGPQGPQGEPGPQGPQGPEGPPGPAPGFRTVAEVITSETLEPGNVWIGEIACEPMQEYSIGGGWDLGYGGIPGVHVFRSMPGVVAPHVYHIAIINETDQEVTLTGSVYAVCATY